MVRFSADEVHLYILKLEEKIWKKQKKCPKCNEVMEKGIVGGANKKVQWGTDFNNFLGTVKNSKDITAYRCIMCGFVEHYAK
jgi:hypothetical protein